MLWDKKAVQKCDTVVANSRFTASNVREIFRVQPTVCDLGIPLAGEQRYCPGRYVGVLTTLSNRKNVRNIVRAIHELVQHRGHSDMRLRIAGRGRKRAKLQQMTADLGITKHVEFVGGIPDSELPDFYRQARLVVYCPIDEPFGLVPLEAMAAKTPVVVSDHGGPSETVEHGKTGLHVNPFDPSSIADAIEALWTNENKARDMADAGYRRTREYYSLEAFVDRFEKIVAKYA